jgi:EmrB/QacA subfamily drug resistance transporter
MVQAQASANSVLSPTEVRSVVTGLMLAILLGALEQTIVSVALPLMSAELKGFELLAWVMSGYLVAVTVATPIYGKLGDLYGRRATLSVAIAIFLIASVACALAQSMPMLVGARILQGLGGGGLISVAQAIIADVVAPRERGRYQGYISTAYATASVSGPLLGGVLTEYLSWRWIFWINLPLGLFALWISRRALARLPVPGVKRPIDYTGAVLLCAGLTALLIGVTRVGQGAPWLAADNLKLFGLATLLLAAFLWQQRRAIEPIIPLVLFGDRTVTISCAVLFIVFFQLVALTVLIPLRLQMVAGSDVDSAAFQLVPLSLGVPLGAYTSGRIVSYVGRYKPLLLAGSALAPIAVLMLAFIDPHATLPSILCMTLAGFSFGLQLPASMVAVQNAVPSRHLGIATAVTAAFRSLGSAIGVAVLTAILLGTLRENAPAWAASLSSAEGIKDMMGATLARMDGTTRLQLTMAVQGTFQKTFIVSAAVACISFVLVLFISNEVLRDRPAH